MSNEQEESSRASEKIRPGGPPVRWGTGSVAFLLVTSALVIYLVARNLMLWPVALRYPGEISDIEGRPMTEMVQLKEGVRIYAPASDQRYDSANYGPIYYAIGARLVNLRRPGYGNLRRLSMLATLGCAAVCALLGLALSGRILVSVLSAAFFLAFPLVHALAITCRCDLGALFLSGSGFLVAYRFRDDRRLLGACSLFALAVGYKMTFAAAPAAVLAYLIIRKQYRRAAEFAAGCGLGFVGLMVFFEKAVYPGQNVMLHMVKYNLLPFSWLRLRFFLILFSLTLLPVTITALESLRRQRDLMMGLYFAWACAAAVMMIAKEGSSSLYFVELVFVSCPLLARLLVSHLEQGDTPAAAQALLMIVASLLLTLWMLRPPSPADFSNDAAIQAYLRQNYRPGTEALSEYAGDLTRASLVTSIPDLYQYSWLRCQGEIPRDQLPKQIRARRFAIILVRTDLTNPAITENSQALCWTEDLRREIVQDYRLAQTFRAPLPDRHLHYYAWVPREHR